MITKTSNIWEAAGAAAFLLALAAGPSPQVASAARNGGGGDNGGNPSKLLVIADFDSVSDVDHLLQWPSTSPYYDGNLNGGWAQMPATGNFTFQLRAGRDSRVIEMDFRDQTSSPPAPDPQFADDGVVVQRSIFSSMNHYCREDLYNSTSGACSDFSASDGSLKVMQYGGQDLLINVWGFYDDPDDSKATIRFRCGPDRNNTIDEAFTTSDLVRAHCAAGRSPTDDTCMQWRLTPFNGDESLSCRLTRWKQSKGSTTVTELGLYDLSFRLTLYRDENGDGVPD